MIKHKTITTQVDVFAHPKFCNEITFNDEVYSCHFLDEPGSGCVLFGAELRQNDKAYFGHYYKSQKCLEAIKEIKIPKPTYYPLKGV